MVSRPCNHHLFLDWWYSIELTCSQCNALQPGGPGCTCSVPVLCPTHWDDVIMCCLSEVKLLQDKYYPTQWRKQGRLSWERFVYCQSLLSRVCPNKRWVAQKQIFGWMKSKNEAIDSTTGEKQRCIEQKGVIEMVFCFALICCNQLSVIFGETGSFLMERKFLFAACQLSS